MVMLSLPPFQASLRHHPRDRAQCLDTFGRVAKAVVVYVLLFLAQIRRWAGGRSARPGRKWDGPGGMGGWVEVPSGFQRTNLSFGSSS